MNLMICRRATFFLPLTALLLLARADTAHGTLLVIPSNAPTTEGSTAGDFGSSEGLVAQEMYPVSEMPGLVSGDVSPA